MADGFNLKDLTSSYDISSEGTLTIGGVKLGGFKSGTLTFTADQVDNSTRDDQGWGKAAPGARNATLEITFNKLKDDACQVGLRGYVVKADFQSKGVEIVYRSESNQTSEGTGFKGTFILTNYSEQQSYDGTAVECSATFASWGELKADNAS